MSAAEESQRTGSWITFDPGAQRIWSLPGETLLDAARRGGVRIASVCGGRGLCKSCVVRVLDGPVSPPSPQDIEFFSVDELSANWRRACQTFAHGDCRIEVSARARAIPTRAEIDSEDIWVPPDPTARLCAVTVPPPTLEHSTSDDHRLLAALNEQWPGAGYRIDLGVQRTLGKLLRATEGKVAAAVRFGEVIGVLPASGNPLLGLAVDVGTTNIGVMLVNLRTGRTLAGQVVENPQSSRGSDVITRVGYARASVERLEKLHKWVVEAVNAAARELCEKHGMNPDHIADVTMAGNTVMHHLFLRLPVDYLGAVPFAPTVSNAVDVKARDVGIAAMPGAYVHALPNIAGFVGGDHTAMLLAIGADREQKTVVALDIGTNTEISLIRESRLSKAGTSAAGCARRPAPSNPSKSTATQCASRRSAARRPSASAARAFWMPPRSSISRASSRRRARCTRRIRACACARASLSSCSPRSPSRAARRSCSRSATSAPFSWPRAPSAPE